MRRREFITFLGGAASVWPLTARAQLSGHNTPHIGVLLAFDKSDPQPQTWLAHFTKGLSQLGWTDGRTVQIDIRWAGDNVDRMQTFAKDWWRFSLT